MIMTALAVNFGTAKRGLSVQTLRPVSSRCAKEAMYQLRYMVERRTKQLNVRNTVEIEIMLQSLKSGRYCAFILCCLECE